MSSKKTNGRNSKESIAPTVLSALTMAPAIITAIEKLIDKLPDIPSKVVVPQLYDLGFPLRLDQAVTMLTNAGLTAMPSELDIKEADPQYRNCVNSEVVGSNMRPKQKVNVGSTVIVRYVTQEVINESKRLFEESEKQKAETNRIKNEEREQLRVRAQKTVTDAATKIKKFPRKILHRKVKGPEPKGL